MDSARSLKRSWLRLYKEPELFDPMYIRFQPRIANKRVGDYCRIINRNHLSYGETVQVVATYSGFVLVQLGIKQFHLREDELEWTKKG